MKSLTAEGKEKIVKVHGIYIYAYKCVSESGFGSQSTLIVNCEGLLSGGRKVSKHLQSRYNQKKNVGETLKLLE